MKFVDYQVLLLFVCGAGLSSFFPLRRKTTSTHLKFALLSSTCRAYSSAPVIESNRKENIILIFRVCYYLKWRNSGFHLGERKRKKNILMKLRITKRMRMTWVKFLYFLIRMISRIEAHLKYGICPFTCSWYHVYLFLDPDER